MAENREDITQAWDAEYAVGRYKDEAPVAFVDDIVRIAREAGANRGLYVGCGNGRNYVPLTAAGLDLVGLDLSAEAIGQLSARIPERADRLIIGEVSVIPADEVFPLVVALQVLQHGDRAAAHDLLAQCLLRVAKRGLFCVRVNAVGTDVYLEHEVVERDEDGSFSVRYLQGPKAGLIVHFWSALELHRALTNAGLMPVLQLRPEATWRQNQINGLWMQWEGIYRR